MIGHVAELPLHAASFNGPIDIGFRMGRGNKGGLKLRRRQIDALLQHRMEESVESLRVARLRRFEIEDVAIREEHREHRSDAIHSNRNAGLARRLQQACFEPRAKRFEFRVRIFLLQPPQRGKTGRNRQRIPDSVPA